MLRLALAGLRHRKLRSAMAILSVAIAVSVVTLTAAILGRMSELVHLAKKRQLNAFPVAGAMQIPRELALAARSVPGVAAVIAVLELQGTDGGRYSYFLGAGGEEYLDVHGPEGWFVVDDQARARWREQPDGVLVHATTLAALGWRDGEPAVAHTDKGDFSLRVSGVATGRSAGNAIIHWEYVDAWRGAHGLPTGVVDNVRLLVKPGADDETVARAVDRRFEEEGVPTLTMTRGELHRWQLETSAPLLGFLTRVSILVLLVTCLVTMSTMAMAMRERRLELATLRALGFSRRRVLALILLEAIAMCLFGGLAGAGVPWALFHRSGLQLGALFLNNVCVSGAMFALGVAVAAGIGIFSSLPVAIWSSRGGVIDLGE